MEPNNVSNLLSISKAIIKMAVDTTGYPAPKANTPVTDTQKNSKATYSIEIPSTKTSNPVEYLTPGGINAY